MILLVLDLIQMLGLTDCFPDLASRVFGLGCSHPLGQLVLVVSEIVEEKQKNGEDVHQLWDIFKKHLFGTMNNNIPNKEIK
jgi:hypothetical protein